MPDSARPAGPPLISLIATGGTISMIGDVGAGGAVPKLSGAELLAHVPGYEGIAEIEVQEFGRYPGPHMTLERMWALRTAILAAIRAGVDGVVVTHGTDTIEETAYLLDRSLQTEVAVAVTGAMRNISELSWDGPANLMSAIQVVASPASAGRGVMVVMDDRIIQGSEAIKTHTEEFGTFQSPNWGPLGIVDSGSVLYYRESRRPAALAPPELALPVDLLKMVAGADSRLLDASRQSGARGVVIEALGRGNVPPETLPGLRRWLESDRPVVLTSRSQRGRVLDSYAYLGGGHELREMGVIFADHLAGQQARIELVLAIGAFGGDTERIRAHFERGRYGG